MKNHIIIVREIPCGSQCRKKVFTWTAIPWSIYEQVIFLHNKNIFLKQNKCCKLCSFYFKFIYFQIMHAIPAIVLKSSLILSVSPESILLGVKISEITGTCWSNLSCFCPLNAFCCWVRHHGIWFIFTFLNWTCIMKWGLPLINSSHYFLFNLKFWKLLF